MKQNRCQHGSTGGPVIDKVANLKLSPVGYAPGIGDKKYSVGGLLQVDVLSLNCGGEENSNINSQHRMQTTRRVGLACLLLNKQFTFDWFPCLPLDFSLAINFRVSLRLTLADQTIELLHFLGW